MADLDESERAAEPARLIARDAETLTDDELVELIRTWGELRRSAPDRIGRVVAVLYQRVLGSTAHISWPPHTRHDVCAVATTCVRRDGVGHAHLRAKLAGSRGGTLTDGAQREAARLERSIPGSR